MSTTKQKAALAAELSARGVKYTRLRGIYNGSKYPVFAIDGARWPAGVTLDTIKPQAIAAGYLPVHGIDEDQAL